MENQEVIYKLGMMEQQLQQLQQQLEAVERGINELERLEMGLDEIPGSKDKEILAQIGRGIYVKAKLVSEELTVSIGDNNFVKKSVPETKELIKEQIQKLKEVENELDNNIRFTNEEFVKMIQEYQKQEKKEE